MRRIKLAIVATCTAVAAAATVTPAYAAEYSLSDDSSLETLSTTINRYGVIEYAKMSVVSIFTLPLTLSLASPQHLAARTSLCVPPKSQSPQPAWLWRQPHSPQQRLMRSNRPNQTQPEPGWY